MYDRQQDFATPRRGDDDRVRRSRPDKLRPMDVGERWRAAFLACVGTWAWIAAIGCGARSTGPLTPPSDAPPWSAQHDAAFDDDFTEAGIGLRGRAPNDVLDQQLLAQRIGFSDLIALTTVLQTYEKHHRGKVETFVVVDVEEILMGEVVPGTARQQRIPLVTEGPLPGDLQDQTLLLFLRWAPGARPPHHHHLMPAEPALLAYLRAAIEHAKDAGALAKSGAIKKNARTDPSVDESATIPRSPRRRKSDKTLDREPKGR